MTQTTEFVGGTEHNTVRIHWENLSTVVTDFISSAEPPVTIIAPFIDPRVLEQIMGRHPVAMVITSWRSDHLLAGVSSLDVYPVVRAFGAKLVVNDRLHAKVMTGNFISSLIGSANVTAQGLGLAARSNLEVVVRLERPTPALKQLFCRLLIDGRSIDDAVYERYRQWLAAMPPIPPAPQIGDSMALLASDPFLISQLPATTSPIDLWERANSGNALPDDVVYDLQLLRVNPLQPWPEFRTALESVLRARPFFGRILNAINEDREGMYFGAVKMLVQQLCTDVPMPHRRDLTTLVQNLYAWIAEVLPNEYEVTRPNYSELIRRRESATRNAEQ